MDRPEVFMDQIGQVQVNQIPAVRDQAERDVTKQFILGHFPLPMEVKKSGA